MIRTRLRFPVARALAAALLLLADSSRSQEPRPSLDDLQSQIDAIGALVPDPGGPRFVDCGDGTVADRQTGLQWEKKTGTPGDLVFCELTPCPDPHDVNSSYKWSETGTAPDGAAFTDFLARLNGEFDPDAATGCFANRCDWRLPEISEFQTILVGPEAAPAQATTCSVEPCVDPDFSALAGPALLGSYWSATTDPDLPTHAHVASHSPGAGGIVVLKDKTFNITFVRAVRTGWCH